MAGNIDDVNKLLELVKKIPYLGDYFRYKEYADNVESAVNKGLTNEIQLLNDPERQADFFNRFKGVERETVISHFLSVKQGKIKEINLAEVLSLVNLDENEKCKSIHPDWMTLWIEKSQMTSDPIKQDLLAKALNIESKKQNTIHPRFFRLFGELSVSEISIFNEYCSYYSDDGYLFIGASENIVHEQNAIPFHIEKMFETAGLVRLSSGLGEMVKLKITNSSYVISYDSYSIKLEKDSKNRKLVTHLYYSSSLTSEGRIMKQISQSKLNIAQVQKYVEYLNNNSEGHSFELWGLNNIGNN